MISFKIPKTPIPVYITVKSGDCYEFVAYNIDDSLEASAFSSSVFIALKQITSRKGAISDLAVLYRSVWSIDDIIDGEYNFMARSISKNNGAKHFFVLTWVGSQDKREQILYDIKEGGRYYFEEN